MSVSLANPMNDDPEPADWEGNSVDCARCENRNNGSVRCAMGHACVQDRYARRVERFFHWNPRVADAWLRIQGETGLFPNAPGLRHDDLDVQTDMIVALAKVGELTGEDRYREAAALTLDGVLRYHRQDSGYVLRVDVGSGNVISTFMKTKFIALFLKALHLYHDGRKIYGTPELLEVLRDR